MGSMRPRRLDRLIDPIVDGEADAVFGSRMLTRGGALEGGMPLYKFLGNKTLTTIQNCLLGKRMSEYHSGYRAYSVDVLKKLPLLENSNDFHFDNEIIVQLVEGDYRIAEVPIPTYYGDEICRVNGIKYAWNVVKTNVVYRMHKLGLTYSPMFDLQHSHKYTYKRNRFSSHARLIELIGSSDNDARVLDIGCGPGHLASELRKSGYHVTGVDMHDSELARRHCDSFRVVSDVEQDLGVRDNERADVVVFADILEHLREPEAVLLRCRQMLGTNGRVIASTGNVAHIFVRLSLLLGQFRYTERGILDRTHTRLFTLSTFRQLFYACGYRVRRRKACPIPFENILPNWPRLAALLTWIYMPFVWVWPSLFAYQTVLECEKDLSPTESLREAVISSEEFTEWETRAAVSRAA